MTSFDLAKTILSCFLQNKVAEKRNYNSPQQMGSGALFGHISKPNPINLRLDLLGVTNTGNKSHIPPVNITKDGKPYPYATVRLNQHAGTSGTFAQKGTQ